MAGCSHPVETRAESGFSLVEVLIALAILGFITLGIVGLFSRSIVVNASGYDYATLSSVTRQSMEFLQSLPFGDSRLADTGGTPATLGDPTGTGNYQIQYTCIDYFVTNWAQVQGTASPPPWPTPTGAQPANMKKITLVVTSRRELEGRRELTTTMLKVPTGG